MRMMLMLAAAALAAAPAGAQSLRSRVLGVGTGSVRFSYEAAEGVCGNGRGNVQIRRNGRTNTISNSDQRNREWEDECEPGPVRVVIDVERGAVTDVRSYVGGRWRGTIATDLGDVPAAEASDYLLSIAETGREEPAKHAVFPAMLARGAAPWARMLRIAKDVGRPRGVRNDAVFWLSQGAADEATKGLQEIVDDPNGDREVRKGAVFALSQRPADEGVPALLRIAKANRDPEIRRSAIFWLGQSRDPRAIAYFEEVLLPR